MTTNIKTKYSNIRLKYLTSLIHISTDEAQNHNILSSYLLSVAFKYKAKNDAAHRDVTQTLSLLGCGYTPSTDRHGEIPATVGRGIA